MARTPNLSNMTKKLLFLTTILLAFVFAAMAADVNGKWVSEQPSRNGGPPRTTTFNFKADGSTLTGTMSGGMGRGGQAPADVQISNGKVEGDNISFDVKRNGPNGEITISYKGTISGDELKLKYSIDMGNGPQEREMTAKRSTT